MRDSWLGLTELGTRIRGQTVPQNFHHMWDCLLRSWDWLGDNAAAIIALIALFVAVWEVCSSRRHNRLSVRPELMEYTDTSVDDLLFRLGVTNAGLGPARILSSSLVYQNNTVPSKRPQDVCAFLDNVLNDVPHHITVELLYPRYVMSQNERRDVVEIRFRDITDQKAREVFARLRALDVDVEFESLYGERDALRP